jgi:hypothetical protein
LEDEINMVFSEVLDDYFSEAELGTPVLYERFKEVCKRERRRINKEH